MVVERWLNHPVLLVGAAVVLVVVSVVVEFEFRTKWSQIGCAVVLVGLGFVGVPIAFGAVVFGGGDGPVVARTAEPGYPERVLTVTDTGFSIDPVYRVELLTGVGRSARHWDLGVWGKGDGRGYFKGAEWSEEGRITVTTEKEIAVFTVDPGSGRPSGPRVTPR
ncbi:hypothetical protein [Kitasatospora sp. NPDC093806]|uniref:hypothetical protein n=1 Tax=Kitasatospora sp. NPDC093806 TaxID=3155075 RepID=UPI0034458F8F